MMCSRTTLRRAAFGAMLLLPVACDTPVVTERLATAPQEFPEPFSELGSMRELPDGRTVVVDRRDGSVETVDLRTGTRQPIGRSGDGPGEYRMPARVFALGRDTTALVDMARPQRLIGFTPGDAPSLLWTPRADSTSPAGSHAGQFVLNAGSSADTLGNVYWETSGASERDSASITRWNRARGRIDTAARLSRQSASPLAKPARAGDDRPRAQGDVPFDAHDQWAVAADGRIALVSVRPYQVRFVLRDGARIVGPVLAFAPVRITGRLKRAYRDERSRPSSVVFYDRAGAQGRGFSTVPWTEPEAWPEVLPPFLADAVHFSSSGMLWIARAHDTVTPPLFDVIGPDGKLVKRIELPANTRLVGFGAAAVYLVRIDENGLEYLQRYPLPRGL